LKIAVKNDEKINELEEENKLLTNTLLQVDNKIKKLEEEIEFLKIRKK
jgi:predicted RNase H-like nuclease (RuvC/YqgF family)